MLRKLTQSYYAKIIFICTFLVIGVSGSLLYLCHRLIRQQEITDYLSSYNIAINSQSAALSSHVTAFADFFFPLIDNSDAYDALCELYLSPNGQISKDKHELLLDTLHNMCRADNYCSGILLLTRSGRLYQYDTRYAALIPLNLTQTSFRFTPYTLQILSDSQLSEMSGDFKKASSHVYGLSGTIWTPQDNSISNLGYLIALYSTEEFSNLVSDSGLDGTADFKIMSGDYNIIFASDGNYSHEDLLYLPPKPASDDFLHNAPHKLVQNGENYYVSYLYQNRYKYFTSYQLPENSLPRSATQNIVFFLGVFISISCILLYGIALRSSDRRVNNIKQGMDLVGQNNLSYRMPVPASKDEFTSIILSFNHMCDELQRNVENTYLFEISQRKAELYAMQTSINPHFLYNALEQIRVQIMQSQYSNASQMLLLLSKMYRYQTKQDLVISIGEECAQMENLINLYSYRTGNCDYEILLDPSLKKYGIPKNILQPLIENCFIHGFRSAEADNMITISISSAQENGQTYLKFMVQDNGTSMTEETLADIRRKLNEPVLNRSETNGFALSNTNSRLTLIFGAGAALNPYIDEHGGFCITFCTPPVLPEDLKKRLQ